MLLRIQPDQLRAFGDPVGVKILREESWFFLVRGKNASPISGQSGHLPVWPVCSRWQVIVRDHLPFANRVHRARR